MKKHRMLTYVFLVLLMAGCTTVSKLAVVNRSAALSPQYQVKTHLQHLNDSLTEIYIRINPAVFRYTRPGGSKTYRPDILINLKVYPSLTIKHPVLEKIIQLKDSSLQKNCQEKMLHYPLKLVSGTNYWLWLQIDDLNQEWHYEDLIAIEKTKNSRGFFQIRQENNNLWMNNFLTAQKKYSLTHIREIDTFYIRFIKTNQEQFPVPPFDMKPEANETNGLRKADQKIAAGENWHPEFSGGYYQIRTSLSDTTGLQLYAGGNRFPELTMDEKFEALKYLTSSRELAQLTVRFAPDEAVHKFWHQQSGTIPRARERMKQYYDRASFSNILFSGQKPGWKTDRGMIFIIFGIPDVVYTTKQQEQWVYGQQESIDKLTFEFKKTDRPFGQTEYRLIRKESYKTPYYKAVERWRN
jgi:GWxTD domain-containing protein